MKQNSHSVLIHYVYILTDPRKPGKFEYPGLDFVFNHEPFYIGKGTNCRWTRHFTKYVLKTGWDNPHKARKINNIIDEGYNPKLFVIFLKTNLSEKQAFELEKQSITAIGRHNCGKGPLVNGTDGGEGACGTKSPCKGKTYEEIYGHEKAKQMKEIRRKRFSGKKNPMYGKISHWRGKHLSEDQKKNLRIKRSIPVLKLDKNGKILERYESIKQAGIVNNVAINAIQNCLKGRSKSSCGFKWKYEKDY